MFENKKYCGINYIPCKIVDIIEDCVDPKLCEKSMKITPDITGTKVILY